MYYSDEVLTDVRLGNDIVDVVSEYVKLKRSGANYFGLCPFHSEKTASFSVNPEKQIYYTNRLQDFIMTVLMPIWARRQGYISTSAV